MIIRKVIGYTRAPFGASDEQLSKLYVESKKGLRSLKKGEFVDIPIIRLSLDCPNSYMIDYQILEDGNGNKTYRPASLYQRAKKVAKAKSLRIS